MSVSATRQQQEPITAAPISPITLPRPETTLIKSKLTPPIPTNVEDPCNEVQINILGSTGDLDAYQIRTHKAGNNTALFENKYEMLESYNDNTDDQSHRSADAGVNTAKISSSNKNSFSDIAEKNSVGRLRIIQVKNGVIDVKSPHKVLDLSEVLEIKHTDANCRTEMESKSQNRPQMIKRVKSQQKQRSQRPDMAQMNKKINPSCGITIKLTRPDVTFSQPDISYMTQIRGKSALQNANKENLCAKSVTAVRLKDLARTRCISPHVNYMVDLNQQAFSSNQTGALRHSKGMRGSQSRHEYNNKQNVHTQIESRFKVSMGQRALAKNKLTHKRRRVSVGSQDRSLLQQQQNLKLLGINNTGTSSALHTRHSMSIRENFSPDIRQDKCGSEMETQSKFFDNLAQKTASSFNTLAAAPLPAQTIKASHNTICPIRNACSRLSNDQSQNYSISHPKEHLLKHMSKQRQEFIVKTFTNSLESKVQRQARQKGSSANPYTRSQLKNSIMANAEIGARVNLDDNQLSLLRNSEDYAESQTRELSQFIRRGGQSIDSCDFNTMKKQTNSVNVAEVGDQATFFAEIPVTRIEDQYYDKASFEKVQLLGGELLVKDGDHQPAINNDEGAIDLMLDTANFMMLTEEQANDELLKQAASTIVKLDQIIQSDSQLIQKHKQLENRVINMKTYARRPKHSLSNQGDLGVCHLKLHARDSKRTTTAHMRQESLYQSKFTRSIESSIEAASQSQVTIRGQSAALYGGLARNSSHIKQAKKQLLRKRIQATRKFKKELSEPLSIRQPNAQRINIFDSAPACSSFHESASITANVERIAHGYQGMVKHVGQNKTHPLIVSAKNFNEVSQQEELECLKTLQDNFNQGSQNDNGIGSADILDITDQKSLQVQLSRPQQHKSLVQMRTVSSRLKIKHKSLLRRSHHNASTKLAYCKKHESLAAVAATIAAADSSEFEIDQSNEQNPYNLTLAERESIKEKNRSLISQFQKSELKKQLFEDPRLASINGRQDTESGALMSDITKIVQTADAAVGQSINFSTGKDLQEAYSSQEQAQGVAESLNSITNEGEGSPSMRLVQQYGFPPQIGLPQESIPRHNDFGIAQLSSSSRTNQENKQSIKRMSFKERPASSKEGTMIMKTVLRNAQNVGIKGNVVAKTQVIAKGVTTRHGRFGSIQNCESTEINKFYENHVDKVQETASRQFNVGQKTNSFNTMEMNTPNNGKVPTHIVRLLKTQDDPSQRQSQNEPFNGDIKTMENNSESMQRLATGRDPLSNNLEKRSTREVYMSSSQKTGAKCGGGTVEDTIEQEVIKLDADQILQLNETQIEKLKMQDVCSAQQVLYSALNELQESLQEASAIRKASLAQSALFNTIQPAENIIKNQLVEQNINSIKRKRFTTNYEGNWKQKVPGGGETPFSMEQKELRKRITHQNQYHSVERKPMQQQYKSLNNQQVKVRLVGEQVSVDRRRDEVDNYFRFKQKQEKVKKRRAKFEHQKQILGQCSPEEVLILGKIKILMDTQNMLVEKAKLCTIQELISPDQAPRTGTFLSKNLSKQSEEIQNKLDISMVLEQSPLLASGGKPVRADGLIVLKHLPSAQRVVSRQSLHKLNRSGDSSLAQTLIIQAAEKLNYINRTNQTRPNSNAIPNNYGNREYKNRAQSNLSSYSDTQAKLKMQYQESFSSNEDQPLLTEPHLKQQKMASTIKLYLKKVQTDRSSVLAQSDQQNGATLTQIKVYEQDIEEADYEQNKAENKHSPCISSKSQVDKTTQIYRSTQQEQQKLLTRLSSRSSGPDYMLQASPQMRADK